MKHTLRITLILVAIFFITQLFGLFTVSQNIEVKKDIKTGVVVIEHKETIVGEPPKSESGVQSVGVLFFAIIIGTIILLLLIKFKINKLFKYWYLFAVVSTISVTLGVYFKFFSTTVNNLSVLAIAILIAYYKIYKGNLILHNISEILIYSGIAVLFVRWFENWLWAIFVFLILISIYDMFAVWKSKHMIKLAKYQSENKVFAGLKIPYELSKGRKEHIVGEPQKGKGTKVAILGGGDIAFPLIFAGTVMSNLILKHGFSKINALGMASIITITSTLALLALLTYGKKDRFYPAMPFISAGSFVGYFIVFLFL